MTMFAINNAKSATILTVGLLSAGLYGCDKDATKHAVSCAGLDHNKTWINDDKTPTKDHGSKCFNCIKKSQDMKKGKFDFKKDMDAATKKKFAEAFEDGANSCGHDHAHELDDDLPEDFLKWVKGGLGIHEDLPCGDFLDSLQQRDDESRMQYVKRIRDSAENVGDDMKDCGDCIENNMSDVWSKCFRDPNDQKKIDATACTGLDSKVVNAAKETESLSEFINYLPRVVGHKCADCVAHNQQMISLSTDTRSNDRCGLVGVGDDLSRAHDVWVIQAEASKEADKFLNEIRDATTEAQLDKISGFVDNMGLKPGSKGAEAFNNLIADKKKAIKNQ